MEVGEKRGMYLRDKANRITLRLNDVQFQFVKAGADDFGISPSEFIRQVINVALRAQRGESSMQQFSAASKLNDAAKADDAAKEVAKES